SNRLARIGFNYFVTEQGGELATQERKRLNFGVFSARFGNLYTTRQLLQLFQESFDGRVPAEAVWRRDDGRFVDALRPQIHPDGSSDEVSVVEARAAHLRCVRRMFEDCEVFVF